MQRVENLVFSRTCNRPEKNRYLYDAAVLEKMRSNMGIDTWCEGGKWQRKAETEKDVPVKVCESDTLS